jgi:cyclophilin family peptidyl-prolyl cis-trans isomerase
VTISTPKGDIVIEVDAALAPVAAANFVALADCGFLDGVVFHRVVPDFVIQGGDGQYGWTGALDEASVGQGGPGYAFPDEPVVGDYTRGTVAMANSGANTNGSQFFICVKDLSDLPKSYTIFGHVTAGMDVVDQIVAAPRNAQDFPDDPVPMTTVTVAPAPSPAASPGPSASASPAPGPTSSPEQPQP